LKVKEDRKERALEVYGEKVVFEVDGERWGERQRERTIVIGRGKRKEH
jgi:hypothetical protein